MWYQQSALLLTVPEACTRSRHITDCREVPPRVACLLQGQGAHRTGLPNPIDEVAVRSATWRSRSMKAPPQMNRMSFVSTCIRGEGCCIRLACSNNAAPLEHMIRAILA